MSPPFLTAPVLAGTRHGFFGRKGGVSEGIYASLNAGPGSRDDLTRVEANRARIATALGVEHTHLLSLHQIHSATAVRVSGPWEGARPQADGIVTTVRGLALSALAADCAPVLFADVEAGVIGAAHAGWKGALGGVLEATVAEMIAAGARAQNIAAAIGPCIAQASYEVGPEFQDAFLAKAAHNARFFAPGAGDRLRFDLKAFCAARLSAAGLTRIDVLPHDTCALAEDFFSNRRAFKTGEADYGRNLSAIVLE